jgi:AcrR family transcriptional regulator
MSRATSKIVEIHRGADTRDRLLRTAQSLFAERGYRGTSLRDISARVGIKAPSLLHHFNSKEQIYLAVLDRIFARMEDAVGSVLMGREGYHERARTAVGGAIDFLAARSDYARIIWNEFIDEKGIGRQMLKRRIPPLYAMGQNFIFHGQREGAFRAEVEPFQFMTSLNSLILGYFTTAAMTRRLWNVNLLDREAIVSRKRHVIDLVEQTLFVRHPQEVADANQTTRADESQSLQHPPKEESPPQ